MNRLVFFSGLALVTASCADEASKKPGAGQVSASSSIIRGVYVSGFEKSALTPCPSRDHCAEPTTMSTTCWTNFSEKGAAAFDRLAARFDVGDYTPFWLEGRAIRTPGKGPFGHLGGYACEIEIVDVTVLDDRPPFRFGPPPYHSDAN